MRLSCVHAWAEPAVAAPALALGDNPVEIDPSFCVGLDDEDLDGKVPSDLGVSCEPSCVDRALYAEEEVYVNSGSSACSSGACLIYHWADSAAAPGAPDGDGVAKEIDFEARAQCSCRCDSRGSGAPECQCGDGFECVDVVTDEGPAALAGGYCVRADSIND
jgi:hypothetical protein